MDSANTSIKVKFIMN